MKKYGHFVRVYGNEITHLRLSKKAEKYYSGTDDIAIYEKENEDGTFSYFTSWNDTELTEAALISMLEDLQDQADACEC